MENETPPLNGLPLLSLPGREDAFRPVTENASLLYVFCSFVLCLFFVGRKKRLSLNLAPLSDPCTHTLKCE